jgi:hypothetical protein
MVAEKSSVWRPHGVNFNFPVETLTDEEIDARIENGLKRIKAGKKP